MIAKVIYTSAGFRETEKREAQLRGNNFGEIENKFWIMPEIRQEVLEGQSISIKKIEKI